MAEKSSTTTRDGAAASAPKASASAAAPATAPHPLQMLQRAAGNRAVTAALADRGGGQPLPDGVRATFEPLFARSFANVRVHTGPQAAQLAEGVGARAFTRGEDIYLKDDRPATVAHELAHVVQQEGARPAQHVGAHGDTHEVEADRAAEEVLRGRRARVASGTAPAMLQRAPGDPPVLAGFQPTIAAQYPALVLLLPEADIAGLEAASEARYRRGSTTETKAAAKEAKTCVEVPLALLLTPEAQFIDLDVWGTFFYFVRGGVAEELQADLARNEIMRRYFERVKLSRFDKLRIEIVDPEGTKPGPTRLRFVIQEKEVLDIKGRIAPPDLTVAFGPIEPDVESVSADADHVALAAHLLTELEEVEPLVNKIASGDMGDYALNYVRKMQGRVTFDLQYVDKLTAHKGPEIPEVSGIDQKYKTLLETAKSSTEKAVAYHAANDLGESLGMTNERWGTSLAGTASDEWDEGGIHYVSGGLAYAGTFLIAFVDAGEKVLSMGFHDAATAVATAYAAGDISYNEAKDILWSAAWRALLTAAITRGAGAIGSRLGTFVAGGVGIATQTTRFGLVAGGVGGVFTSASSLAAQSVLTSRKSDSFSPTGQAIWNQGMPTGTSWALGLGLGGGLGALGGAWSVQVANLQRIGSIVQTPTGPMRIIAITRDGAEVLEPLAGRVRVPAGYGGPTVNVPPEWQPSSLVPAGQSAMSVAPQPFGQTPYTGGMSPMGLSTVGILGQAGQPFGMLPAGPQPFGMLPAGPQPFGMLPAGPQPFGMLPAGSQPFGMLPAGPQPFGMLPPGPQPFGMLPAGPQPFGMLPAGPQPFGILPPGPQPFGLLPAAPEPVPLGGLMLAPEARLIPGTPGVTTGGSSQALGKATMQSFGLARSTSFSGWQPHHIIPSELMKHPVMVKIGMDFDHPSNSIMLPEPATNWPGNLPTHQGYHSAYNAAVKAELDAMDVNLPIDVLLVKVFRMQLRLRAALERGTPLYYSKGATPTTWPNILNPPP